MADLRGVLERAAAAREALEASMEAEKEQKKKPKKQKRRQKISCQQKQWKQARICEEY